MMKRFLWGLAFCLCAVSAGAAQSRHEREAARLAAAFADRVRNYGTLDAAGRGDTRQGDIFTTELTNEFLEIIRKEFRGKDARNIRRTIRESDPIATTVLRVNEIYPEDLPITTMPPTLLRHLPEPPMELVYRIIGRALVLENTKTSVIVDFIPDAIPVRRAR